MIRAALLALLALQPPLPTPTPADFTVCVPINNGPIERPDHYGLPYQRKADLA